MRSTSLLAVGMVAALTVVGCNAKVKQGDKWSLAYTTWAAGPTDAPTGHVVPLQVPTAHLVPLQASIGHIVPLQAPTGHLVPLQGQTDIPGSPVGNKPGQQPCKTIMLVSGDSTKYAVVIVKGWVGSRKPSTGSRNMYQGEDFSGLLDFGPATLHDDSNSYDLNVEVIYKSDSYEAAKARTDAACGAPP